MKALTQAEERYIHLASSSHDLNYAWYVLQEIRKEPSNPLNGTAFMFALICYARPYTVSRGELQRYVLDTQHVPTEHAALHDRLLSARHKILAHSDLTVKEARLHVANTSTGKFVGVVQNTIFGTEEFGNLDTIVDLIEKTLRSLYASLDHLKSNLPPNA